MNIKQYLIEKNISIRRIAQRTGIPYSTLNDLINNKTDIEKIQFGHIRKIATYLNISLDDIYSMCKPALPEIPDGKIIIKNKQYFLVYETDNNQIEIRLHKIDNDIKPFIKDLATWTIESLRQEELLKTWKLHTS